MPTESAAHRRTPQHAALRRRAVSRSRGMVLTLVLALALGMGGTAAYASLAGNVPAAKAQDRLVVRGGVIRLGTQVYLHTNGSHAAVGFTRIALLNKCRLRVYFDRARGERIVSAVAEEDETMARLRVQAGISGGVDFADVRLFRDGKEVCANHKRFGNRSNLWISLTYLANAPAKPVASPVKPTSAPPTSPPPAAAPTPAPTSTTAPAPAPEAAAPKQPRTAAPAQTASPSAPSEDPVGATQ